MFFACSIYHSSYQKDKDGKVTRGEIESLVSTLGGETDCPHVQVSLLSFNFLVEVSQMFTFI